MGRAHVHVSTHPEDVVYAPLTSLHGGGLTTTTWYKDLVSG